MVNTVQYPARGRKRKCGQRGGGGERKEEQGGGRGGEGGDMVKERYRLQRN